MKNILQKIKRQVIDDRGNVDAEIGLFVGILGFLLFAAPIYFDFPLYILILSMILGLAMSCILAYSLQARTLDLRPFTSDPLAWRKAKKTYKDGATITDEAMSSNLLDNEINLTATDDKSK